MPLHVYKYKDPEARLGGTEHRQRGEQTEEEASSLLNKKKKKIE